jgi:hypothetical protein
MYVYKNQGGRRLVTGELLLWYEKFDKTNLQLLVTYNDSAVNTYSTANSSGLLYDLFKSKFSTLTPALHLVWIQR